MNMSRADHIMNRLLFIDTSPVVTEQSYEQQSRQAENALTLSLAFSGVRCFIAICATAILITDYWCGG